MRKQENNRKWWTFSAIAIGAGLLTAVVATTTLPREWIRAFFVLGGVLFSLAAFGLGWAQRAPYQIGKVVRAGLLFGGIWAGVAFGFICVAQPDVILTPTSVSFQSSDVSDTYIVTVRNRTDDDIYAVAVKFRIGSGDLDLKDFSLCIPASSRKRLMPGSMPSDVAEFHCLDSHDSPFRAVAFVHLGPGERREIIVSRKNNRRGTVIPELAHFTRDQRAQYENALVFSLGEPTKCDEMVLYP